MRVVIGSGNSRHEFEVPRDRDERQAMIDDVIRIIFRNK